MTEQSIRWMRKGITTPKGTPKSEEELAAESYAAQIVSAVTNAGMTKPQRQMPSTTGFGQT